LNSEINIISYVRLILSKWWLILTLTLAGGAAAFAYTRYFVTPVYMSQGTLYVTNTNSTYNIVTVSPTNDVSKNVSLSDMYASQRLATTCIEILKSDTFLRAINEKIGGAYAPAGLRKVIAVDAVNDTEILMVQAFSAVPQHAAEIVQTMLDHANDEIQRVINGGSADVIDAANTPIVPYGPNTRKNTLVGAVFGGLLSLALVYLLDLFDDRVKSQEDLLQKHRLPVLGLIPGFQKVRKPYC
jgi:capsular polysaccharide biosynthesis protein